MAFAAPPGVFDIVPNSESEPWRSAYIWRYVEGLAHKISSRFGFEELRTPIFEKEELFIRSVGTETDIVSKELYAFEDKGGRRLALRPEGTAPAMRAIVENNLSQHSPQQKLYYLAPMFRYERPQAGRFRQHYQFGVEAIGVATPAQDLEVIDLLWSFYQALGLSGLTLHINSLGKEAERHAYRAELVAYLSTKKDSLSADSRKRLDLNPLRILDSKDAHDIEILQEAPKMADFLQGESASHFAVLQGLLKDISIPFAINHKLVRGLDYYNGVIFEVTSSALGAQNAIGGGGRYDGLLKQLGGPDLPSIGFGCGLERIIQTLLAQGVSPAPPAGPLVFFIPLGESALKCCLGLIHNLRKEGFHVEMELGGRKLAKSMHYADAIKARYVAVIGDDEMAQQQCKLKEMATGTSEIISLMQIDQFLSRGSK